MFQGMYREGERYGPGVMTYPDGRQDVGLWHRERLVRLLSAPEVPAFTLSSFSEHMLSVAERPRDLVTAVPPGGCRGMYVSASQLNRSESKFGIRRWYEEVRIWDGGSC